MKLSIHPVGPLKTNCYIVEDVSRKCLIIDPGEEAERLIQYIQKNQLEPVAVLLTHAHFDHIGAVEAMRKQFAVPVYLHELEKEWMSDSHLNGSARYPSIPPIQNDDADVHFTEDGLLTILPFELEVRHTPGHSPGSVSFVFEEQGFAIVGDTLFSGGIGRTDLVGGDTTTLIRAIQNQLLTLDPDTSIFPGHGQSTTPQQAMDTNPYLHGFD